MPQTLSRNEYQRRIHAVQDYMEAHLSGAPGLAELAAAAGFSRYHFHRIFHAITRQTPLQYGNRIRLERAAAYLLHSPRVSVTELALHYGFADSAVFARAFKAHFGVSPSAYRRKDSKNGKAESDCARYDGSIQSKQSGRDCMKAEPISVEIKNESLRVIYVRFTGSYPELGKAMPGMMQKVYRFAVAGKLLEYGKTKILCAYHDNPELTGEGQLRVSLCMSVPAAAQIELKDEIGLMTLEGCFGVGHFELYQKDYKEAWQTMYGEWLPGSGMQPRDAVPFEVYVSNPSKNPGGKQLLDIYVPVEPLGPI